MLYFGPNFFSNTPHVMEITKFHGVELGQGENFRQKGNFCVKICLLSEFYCMNNFFHLFFFHVSV